MNIKKGQDVIITSLDNNIRGLITNKYGTRLEVESEKYGRLLINTHLQKIYFKDCRFKEPEQLVKICNN